MSKVAWRKKYELPPGYIQEPLFPANRQREQPKHFFPVFMWSVIFVFLFAVFLTQQIHVSVFSRELARLEQTRDSLHRENEALKLQYTQSENLIYVEAVAMQKLHMVRPTQVLYLTPLEFAAR